MAKRLKTLKTRYLKNGRVSLTYRGYTMLKNATSESAEMFKVGWYENQGHEYWPFGKKPEAK